MSKKNKEMKIALQPRDYDRLSITEATKEQQFLREKLSLKPLYDKRIKTIGGADISLNRFSEVIYAGIVVLDYQTLQPLSVALVKSKTKFPYVPGFLAFREVPALVEALTLFSEKPDLIMVDGHGIAHPRRMGIAAHLGVLTEIPTLGCAKKKLYGNYIEPGLNKGDSSELKAKEEMLGHVLRTKSKVKPVFISPGSGIGIADSLHIAKHCIGKYRLPEPTRKAHEFVNLFRTGVINEGFHSLITNPSLF